VINAAITTLYADPSGEGYLFRPFCQPQGLERLLRPDSQMEGGLVERSLKGKYIISVEGRDTLG